MAYNGRLDVNMTKRFIYIMLLVHKILLEKSGIPMAFYDLSSVEWCTPDRLAPNK